MNQKKICQFRYFIGVMIALVLCALFCHNSYAENVASAEAKVSLVTDKVTHIVGPIFADQLHKFYLEMAETTYIAGDRLVLISSPGGDVHVGEIMLDFLLREKQVQHNKLICIAVGEASSMAFNILTRCDVRLATPESTFVVHNMALGGFDPSERLTAQRLREMADQMDLEELPFVIYNSIAMGMEIPEYQKYAALETRWTAVELFDRHYLHGMGIVVK